MSALDEASTVGGLLLRSARRWPDSPALVEGQTVLTHRQAASRARTVARRLAARGVRRGDRVALALPNGWRYAVTYLGVQLAGGTAVLVNTRFAPPEIEYVLGDSDACAAVVDAETSARVPRLCPQWDVDELTGPGAEADELPGLAAGGTDIANILYTSGTTGRPKGAMQTHGTLREWAGTQLADYKLPAELVILSALPRNASGKVIKKQLAAQLAEQLAGTRSPSAPART
jgi:fatty-acyl-CoA synthase